MLKIISSLILFVQLCAGNSVILPEIHGDQFYYFGYGSNLLTARMQLQNPSAKRVGYGLIRDYSLDFNTYTSRWLGTAATIIPMPNATVYGSLWLIDLSDMPHLDDQEGVHEGHYKAVSLPVEFSKTNSTKPEIIVSRVYLVVAQPTIALSTYQYNEVPSDRQPSKTYLQCLVAGAIESDLPNSYVEWLRSLHHNSQVEPMLEEKLNLKDVQLLH